MSGYQAAPGAIDFSDVINDSLENYVSRNLLTTDLEQRLSFANPGVILIVGGPGTGKTALSADFVQRNGYLHHFFRRGHTEFGLWRDPYAFLTSIGFQLKSCFGDGLFPDQQQIIVTGHVTDVGPHGEYVGAEVEQLRSLPWYDPRFVSVDLQAKRIEGKATGVRFLQVVQDYHHIPLHSFRDLALVDPLARLAESDSSRHAVLWIDGLDEELNDEFARTGNTIGSILPSNSEVQAIGNLTLVISSRRGPHLDRFREDGADIIDLDDDSYKQDTLVALDQYLDGLLQEPHVRAQIEHSSADLSQNIQQIVTTSKGNFLYARQISEAVAQGDLDLILQGKLPEDLDEIYARLMSRLASRFDDDFLDYLYPILSILAVARDSLLASQLAEITGIQRNRVNQTLTRLRPYLTPRTEGTQQAWSIYHGSFAETLTSEMHADSTWWIDQDEAHRTIAHFYLAFGEKDWQAMDDYGFAHLAWHLGNAGDVEQRELLTLIGESWRYARRQHDRSHAGFLKDVETASGVVDGLPYPERLLEPVRLGLIYNKILESQEKIPEAAVQALVLTGQLNRALQYTEIGADNTQKINSLRTIIESLADLTEPALEAIRPLFKAGLRMLEVDPDHRFLGRFLSAVPACADANWSQLVSKATEIFNLSAKNWATPMCLGELARLIAPIDSAAASQTFEQARDALKLSTSAASFYWLKIFGYWIDFEPDQAVEAFNRTSLGADANSARTLALAGKRSGNEVWAHDGLRNQILPAIDDPFEKGLALAVLAELQHSLDRNEDAEKSLSRAMHYAQIMGTEEDPEHTLQNRGSQKSDLLLDIARIRCEVQSPKSESALKMAWTGIRAHGLFNGDLKQLIRTQLSYDSEGLSGRLEQSASCDLYPALLSTAAQVLAKKDIESASGLLEKALEMAEGTRDRDALWWQRQMVSPSIARAMPEQYLEETRDFFAEHDFMAHEDQVIWQVQVLAALLSEGSSQAQVWMDMTLPMLDQYLGNDVLQAVNPLCSLDADCASLLLGKIDLVTGKAARCALQGVLASTLFEQDGDTASEYLNNAISSLDTAIQAESRVTTPELLAFIAGHWYTTDAKKAQSFLNQALLRQKSAANAAALLPYVLKAYSLGAPPEALLAILLCTETLDKALQELKNTIVFMSPSPATPVLAGSGFSPTQQLLTDCLARLLATTETDLLKTIDMLQPGPEKIFTQLRAAIDAGTAPAEQRYDWVMAASEHISEIPEDYIQALAYAESATALLTLGKTEDAVIRARELTEQVLVEGRNLESIYRDNAYPHTIGKCMQVMAHTPEADKLPEVLWKARLLGIGYLRFLQYLPAILAENDSRAPMRLFNIFNQVNALFSRRTQQH